MSFKWFFWLSVFLLLMVIASPSAFAGENCSLLVSANEIMVGQSVAWSVIAPAGQKYIWYVSDPYFGFGPAFRTVSGEGLTPWSGLYKYDNPGIYTVYFQIEDSSFVCKSNIVTLTVHPVFVAGTNFFPRGGTFVDGQDFQIRAYSNVASGITLHYAFGVIDNELVSLFPRPSLPLFAIYDSSQFRRLGVGKHTLMIVMETSRGRFAEDVEVNIIPEGSATPQQKPQTTCIPLPSVGSSPCVQVPVPPPPPSAGPRG